MGILHALAEFRGEAVDAKRLAEEAIGLERDTMAEIGGHQDQILCAHGGFRQVQFHQTGQVVLSPSMDVAKELSDWLVLVYTGVKRHSSQISAAFVERLDSHENDLLLNELNSLTREAARVLDSQDGLDMTEMGRLLNESWRLKARMNPLAVPTEIEDLHETARQAGALGGKISGAGGGGFCVFLVDPERQDYFIQQMQPCLVVPFSFVERGSEIIFHDRNAGIPSDSSFGGPSRETD